MATVQGSTILSEARLYDASWGPFAANADVGTPITIPAHVRELTVQTVGSFGTALAIQLQGSNDNVNYSQLKDTSNTAISMTDTSVVRWANPPRYVKPVATAGSGGAATVYIHGMVAG